MALPEVDHQFLQLLTIAYNHFPGAANSVTVTASDSNTDTDTVARPKRNRFSVEMDVNQLPMKREDSQRASIKEEEIETESFDIESVGSKKTSDVMNQCICV